MDEKREKLIRDAWDWFKQTPYEWPLDLPFLNVPVPQKTAIWEATSDDTALLDYLTFKIERGRYDGEPMHRVVCEGVVVEMFRP